MPTLADLTADIADDADDTSGEYGAQITSAVQAAIRYCERTLYYWNETRDETFSTVIGQEWYGAAANANIPTLVKIQAVWLTDTGGNILELFRTSPEHIEQIQDSTANNNTPFWWTYFKQQIRLHPAPNVVYQVRLQIGPYRLVMPSDPTDTSAWFDEAYDMIKARAKYNLYKNTLKDAGLAAEALQDYRDQHKGLKAETARRTGTGYFIPTQF